MLRKAEDSERDRIGAANGATVFPRMPTINLTNPDPACDLDFLPVTGRAASVEAALCNCLGFGSKNSALVLGAVL